MQRLHLQNGIAIVNFSSPHSFKFITGEELGACDVDWTKKMALNIKETETVTLSNEYSPERTWTDVQLDISIPKNVKKVLDELTNDRYVDIVLVPFMMLEAMKSEGLNTSKFRTIRIADRITKEIYSDRFCS
ncbi:hypothetical protein CL614_06575 [archaeon]|jgi:hypothetical protein|nr:hypothetical protein [archaeon]|tara:strand:+ start:518 stop:913 length:396 start_codon:yes stop_codon:yes gene_type:complete